MDEIEIGRRHILGRGAEVEVGVEGVARLEDASTEAMIPICADQFLALGPDAQAEYASTKVSDRDDVIRKHLKKVGALSVDYSFARACASAIDTRGKTIGKST